ncbi:MULTISPECIES: collagen-like protein [unclassified Streptococcus]|uniref:collagen-like triple helix repeat-containing protein n=1 Tax=unclassified Streptococcus TaxID=2608887 RepID=UPI00156635B0|nr:MULTISPECIES: collagen-like protein [unclassified Streptococcus]
MSNLENLARAIGEDVKAIKEDSELKDREVQERLDSLESRPRVNPETLVTKAELEEKGYLTSHQDLSTYTQKWELYNDIPIKARISALENRPSFDNLTSSQRESLKGENGHSLNASVRIEGSYKNGSTSQLNLFADVFYDGEAVTSGYTLDYYYRGFGNNSWGVLRNQTPDANGKFGQWNATQRSGGWFEVRIEVNYRGLKASAFTHLDNINDGERGAAGERGPQGVQGERGQQGLQGIQGPRGADGAPGQNIINQNGGQALKYWVGTKAQYEAIRTKDPNTIYDVYEPK